MHFLKKTGAVCLTAGVLLCSSGLYTEAEASAAAAVEVPAQTKAESSGIRSVTSISLVYGDGEKPAAAAVEYPADLAADSLSAQDFSVEGQTITAVYTNDKPALTTKNVPGRYAILCFAHQNSVSDQAMPAKKPPADAGQGQRRDGDAPLHSNRQMPELSLRVKQTGIVQAKNGTVYSPAESVIASTAQLEPSLDGFQQYVYTDPAMGYQIPYQLYLSRNYDAAKKYPLVFFIADASANTEQARMVLVQGSGAAVWADPAEQARHECIVLAPAYTRGLVDSLGMMTDDSNTWTKGLTLVSDLLFDVMHRYSVDTNRIYGTGQSQGGMANIAISDRYPDLFAAQYLVACQWNVDEMEAMKDKKLWIMVSEGDTKAYPGMNEATRRWEQLGSRVARSALWNSKSTPEEFAALVRQTESQKAAINYTVFQGGNHMYTWSVAYDIPGIRDWLFAQKK